jgi:hypothetical protein
MIDSESTTPAIETPAQVSDSSSASAAPRGIAKTQKLFRGMLSRMDRVTRWKRLARWVLRPRRRKLPRDVFVIHVAWGGLGDHLFFSHLPRIAKESGYRHVYVAAHSEFRHEDYRWVWMLNPYVDGFAEAEPSHPVPAFAEVPNDMNLLDRIMLECGLDDGRRQHEPEFYYRPRTLAQYRDKTVYDPNYVSDVGKIEVRRISELFDESRISVDYQLSPRQKYYALEGLTSLQTPELFDYCDLIHSCRRFICLTSGGATLAAALGKECTALYGAGQKPMFHHSRLHEYIRV